MRSSSCQHSLLAIRRRLGYSINSSTCVRALAQLIPRVELIQGQTVYKDLPHPPSGYLSTPIIDQVSQPSSVSQGVQVVDQGTQQTGQGSRPRAHEPRIRYASRSNDGSGYNPLFPSLGKAGEPYARSVPSLHYRPASSLPDAGVVFDTLMKRRVDQFTPHPSGISSVRAAVDKCCSWNNQTIALLCIREPDHPHMFQHKL
jgi:hypothetical protein